MKLEDRDIQSLLLCQRFLDEGVFTLKGVDTYKLTECRLWITDFLKRSQQKQGAPEVKPISEPHAPPLRKKTSKKKASK